MSLDPLNIILLAVVLVVFWRLRSVLGTRTGTEKPPIDPFEVRRPEPSQAEQPGTVIRFPQNGTGETPAPVEEEEPKAPVWTGYADPGSDLAKTIEAIAAADPTFTPKDFIEGAKMAYEMVIDGYAKGDKAALKTLLSKEVFDGFSAAIDAREAAGQRVESRFVGIDKSLIRSAVLKGSLAAITLEFVSELISATYAKTGEVVDGDPRQIREITDVWTFERDLTSRNPNWKLVATQAPA